MIVKKVVALSREEYRKLKEKADAYDALIGQIEQEEPENPPEEEVDNDQ